MKQRTSQRLLALLLTAALLTSSGCLPVFSKSKPTISGSASRAGASGGVSKGLFEW
ncbi:MAG: hypothetical protein HQL53_00970 [Magnetococcales bacterium]|nr:hypothetical protein [Magnetococcales bacterium]